MPVPVPAKDIAQSLTVVNKKLIRDQGNDSFKSALENVAGITFEAGEGVQTDVRDWRPA